MTLECLGKMVDTQRKPAVAACPGKLHAETENLKLRGRMPSDCGQQGTAEATSAVQSMTLTARPGTPLS